jgi:hypothetical protein
LQVRPCPRSAVRHSGLQTLPTGSTPPVSPSDCSDIFKHVSSAETDINRQVKTFRLTYFVIHKVLRYSIQLNIINPGFHRLNCLKRNISYQASVVLPTSLSRIDDFTRAGSVTLRRFLTCSVFHDLKIER